MMYAKLKPVVLLNKTLDKLEVNVVSYTLGTSRPTLGYKIICSDDSSLSQGNINLDPETYSQWSTNDEIILEYVASQLNVEILEIVKPSSKTSEDFLKEDPSLETR